MSEVYNPEADRFQELEALELEARQLAKKRDEASADPERQVYEKQLKEVEDRIAILKKKLRP